MVRLGLAAQGQADDRVRAVKLLETLPRFPCRRSDKAPLTGHSFYDAVVNTDHSFWPLVGVPTGAVSGFDVLDIDPRHGGDLWLEQHRDRIPATRVHHTRGGGQHFLFRYAGVRLRKEIAPGVEFKSDGGYIVWWPREGLPFENRQIAAWPAWLLELATRQTGNNREDLVTSLSLPTWAQALSTHQQSAPRWSREETFAHYALDHAMRRIYSTPYGQRETTLNGESYAIGRLIGAGWISLGRSAVGIEHAIKSNPRTNDRGERFVEAHGIEFVRWKILRALHDGMAKPYPALGGDHVLPSHKST
jgi:hypothetical protein